MKRQDNLELDTQEADGDREGVDIQAVPLRPALLASPVLTSTLFATVPLAIAIFDADLVCQGVNPAFAHLAGGSPASYAGRPAHDVLPLSTSVILTDLRRVLSAGVPVISKEMLGYTASLPGNRRVWSVDIQPVANADSGVESVCVYLSETTERHKTETLARDAMQRLAFHVENTPLAVIEFDNNFQVSLWSARAEAMFGWTEEEVVGLHPSDWPFVLEDDMPTVERTMNDLQDGVLRNVSHNRNRAKDGRVVFCEWYNSALRDRDGSILSVLSLVQDVTSQRDAAQKQRRFFREMLESLTEGRLWLCDTWDDLPDALPQIGDVIALLPRSLHRVRREVGAVASDVQLTHERKDELITAVSEAAMNAVVHAGGGEARICADVEKGRVQVWVRDWGAGIREDTIHRATLEKGFSSAGSLGHGFWMMLKTADCVFLLTGPQGTTVVLEQNRTPSEPAWLRNARLITTPLDPVAKYRMSHEEACQESAVPLQED